MRTLALVLIAVGVCLASEWPCNNPLGCLPFSHPEDNTGYRVNNSNIWIGGASAASNRGWLTQEGIQVIVSLSGEHTGGRHPNMHYLVKAIDGINHKHIRAHVLDVHEYLKTHSDKRVLVYCKFGSEISPVMIAGHFLLSDWTLGVDEALEAVSNALERVRPNPTYVVELYDIESSLYVMALETKSRRARYLESLRDEL